MMNFPGNLLTMTSDVLEEEAAEIISEIFNTDEYHSRVSKSSAIIKEFIIRECLKRRKVSETIIREILNNFLEVSSARRVFQFQEN